jgi:hypothetical protein
MGAIIMNRQTWPFIRRCIVAVIVVVCTVCAIPAHGAACAVPSFVQIGTTYKLLIGAVAVEVIVLAIDTPACWIQVQDEKGDKFWMNLHQIVAMEEKAR